MPPETPELEERVGYEERIRRLEECLREQEAELAGAKAEIAGLEQVIGRMGYQPQQNAAPEGADAPAEPDDPKDPVA